jgi:hypothetical protein
VPVGEVTVIVPVVNRQVGWMVVAAGVEGAPGAALIVSDVPGDIQPLEFFAVTVYVFGANRSKIGLDW